MPTGATTDVIGGVLSHRWIVFFDVKQMKCGLRWSADAGRDRPMNWKRYGTKSLWKNTVGYEPQR
jgi:hypothetical protein